MFLPVGKSDEGLIVTAPPDNVTCPDETAMVSITFPVDGSPS